VSLVLDIVDSSFSSPVNRCRKVVGWKFSDSLILTNLRWKFSSESVQLIFSQGGELVVSNCVSILWVGVDLIELGISLGKLVKSERILLLGSIGKTMVRNMLSELLFDGNGGIWNEIALVDSSISNSLADNVHVQLINNNVEISF